MINTRFAQTVLVIGVALGTVSIGSSAQPSIPPACCHITAIDGSRGVVTAKPMDTGAAFRFKFDSGSLPGRLKVDQPVWAGGGKVSLNGTQNCCTIIPAAPNARALLGAKTSSSYQTAYSAESTSHARECDQVAQRSFPQGGHKCIPKATMISSGKSPDGSHATYSWTCVCT